MGHQIIRQPNHKFGIWSSIVDDFVLVNATREDIIQYYIKESEKNIRLSVYTEMDALDSGERPHAQFTKSFRQAIDWIGEVHGEERRKKREEEMACR